jgi:peptidyl-prolyl cis-trans isomerase B (cyclophilin B)
VAGQKREREVERARYERQQARRAQRSAKTKRRERIIASVVVAVLAVGGLAYLSSVLGDDGAETATPDVSTPTSPTALNCTPPNDKKPSGKQYEKPQDITLKPDSRYSVALNTNCGDIDIIFDSKAAPKNVASFIGLANDGYFDNTMCHRLTTEGLYVLQCGDPKGNGTGGPGYELPDENLPEQGDNNYPAGTVAMANAGANTGGSQFFLVYRDTTLGPNYTILGTMSSGLETVQAIAAEGTANGSADGPPKQPVQILTAKTAETTQVGG